MSDATGPFRLDVPRAVTPLPFRVGHGYDLHRLQPGGRLMLGGVLVSEEVSPVAHSDGDVVIHAVVDALLGAMAWGDIGQHFPDSDPRWKGASSMRFLDAVYNEVASFDYRLQTLDITVLAESPRLSPFRAEIVRTLAEVTGGEINLKAGTNEGCDAIGRGEAIAAHAVVLLGGDF